MQEDNEADSENEKYEISMIEEEEQKQLLTTHDIAHLTINYNKNVLNLHGKVVGAI